MGRDEASTGPGEGEKASRQPGRAAPRLAEFVLYSRRYCHLCDEMLAALQAQLGMAAAVSVVDVDSDPALEARYGDEVPVLVCGQTEVCRHRHDAEKVAAFITQSR